MHDEHDDDDDDKDTIMEDEKKHSSSNKRKLEEHSTAIEHPKKKSNKEAVHTETIYTHFKDSVNGATKGLLSDEQRELFHEIHLGLSKLAQEACVIGNATVLRLFDPFLAIDDSILWNADFGVHFLSFLNDKQNKDRFNRYLWLNQAWCLDTIRACYGGRANKEILRTYQDIAHMDTDHSDVKDLHLMMSQIACTMAANITVHIRQAFYGRQKKFYRRFLQTLTGSKSVYLLTDMVNYPSSSSEYRNAKAEIYDKFGAQAEAVISFVQNQRLAINIDDVTIDDRVMDENQVKFLLYSLCLSKAWSLISPDDAKLLGSALPLRKFATSGFLWTSSSAAQLFVKLGINSPPHLQDWQSKFALFAKLPRQQGWEFCGSFNSDGTTYISYQLERCIVTRSSSEPREIDLADKKLVNSHRPKIFDECEVTATAPKSIRPVGVDAGCETILALHDLSSGEQMSYSKKWHHHQLGAFVHRRRRKRWREFAPDAIKDALQNMSDHSLKTWSYKVFLHEWSCLAPSIPQIFAFYGDSRFNKQRWRSYTLKQRTYSRLVNSIKQWLENANPDDQRPVVLAYGGAKFKTSWRGQLSGPRGDIMLRLSHSFPVVTIPEYRSSKLCSTCYEELAVSDHPSQSSEKRRGKRKTVYRSRSCLL